MSAGERSTWTRDLSEYVDRHGHISVEVKISVPGSASSAEARETGASAKPATIARFLRELADDVERAGRGSRG